jgi:hypothetical protein
MAAPSNMMRQTAYYLRYTFNGKCKWEPVGADLNRAFVQFQNRELNQTGTQLGLTPVTEFAPKDKSGRTRISHEVAVYLQDLADATKTGERSKGTERGYKNAVEDFRGIAIFTVSSAGPSWFRELEARKRKRALARIYLSLLTLCSESLHHYFTDAGADTFVVFTQQEQRGELVPCTEG